MAAPNKQLVLMIIRFLKDHNLHATAHMLEQESGFFFDVKYFETLVMEGKYEEAEKYFSGFTTMDDNWHSMWVFFELKKQKYLEALEKKDIPKALDILLKELQDFNRHSETIVKEAMALLTLDNFREHPSLVGYGDTQLERVHMVHSIKKSLLWNPMLQGKLHLPAANSFNVQGMVVNGEAGGAPLGGRHGNERGRWD